MCAYNFAQQRYAFLSKWPKENDSFSSWASKNVKKHVTASVFITIESWILGRRRKHWKHRFAETPKFLNNVFSRHRRVFFLVFFWAPVVGSFRLTSANPSGADIRTVDVDWPIFFCNLERSTNPSLWSFVRNPLLYDDFAWNVLSVQKKWLTLHRWIYSCCYLCQQDRGESIEPNYANPSYNGKEIRYIHQLFT